MLIAKPEVLSPAGSSESLISAVRSGADAVYLGVKEFSARRNADNFDFCELEKAVKYCHIRNVKVYLTLNIMIKESELNTALECAKKAYLCGVDALILQDTGIASLIKNAIPDFELHASTQMTVHSPAALQTLKEMGFSRVVAAREMNKNQLALLCKRAKELDMTVEVFVHGALCMCVSGQCLLSCVLGARSGNRGLCAGPCRLPFSSQNGSGYDLSLKDLSLFEHIKELEEIGVSSLKIEGRMKRPEYVACATFACRKAVDEGTVPDEISKMLKGVFSRSGFTDGYFTGNISKDMFGIRTKDDVTSAKETFALIHELYRSERKNAGIDLSAEITEGKPLKLCVCDGQNTVIANGDIPQKAKNQPTKEEDVYKNLCKTGATPYYVKNADIVIGSNLFVSASQINSLRRTALLKLDEIRGKNSRALPEITKNIEIKDAKHSISHEIYCRFPNKESIPIKFANIKGIILPWYEAFPENRNDTELIAELPRYIDDESILLNRLLKLKKDGINTAFCSNISAISIAKSIGFKIIGGTGLNIANSFSALFAENKGASCVTVSPELDLKAIANIKCSAKKMLFAYGRMPLMVTKNCPLKNSRQCKECDRKGFITDRKGIDFPVRCTPWYSELLNSEYTYLADRLDEIINIDCLLLYFTDESPQKAEKIIEEYTFGATAPSEYTRGLYYRNLL